ncbi:MAG TPA: Do family serine endopeptidase [Devosiaceae bacterium]
MRSVPGLRLLVAIFLAMPIAGAVGFPPVLAQGPISVAPLARELSPAVVNISTTRKVPSGAGVPFPKGPEGSDLNDLLKNLNPNQGLDDETMQEARSLGSGFVVAADGTIVTNNHVIEGADEVLVYFTDGTRLPAKVLGSDQKTDLAVLKVDAGHDLPFVSFGDSDHAEVGDWVMAIGNPFGLGGSVSLGIVSARNRDINSGPYDAFIQTDAAINQGNSGGPLFDMDGKVIGINTAIVAQGGSSLGIGFAVPSNLAQPVVDQLRQFGETRRGWLGVGIQDVTDDIAASMGRTDTHGALVVEVTKGGPSDGILADGDLILSFDGRAIDQMHDLPRIVATTPIGKSVTVTVLRGGQQKQFDIRLGRLEDGEKLIAKLDAESAPPPPADSSNDAASLETAPSHELSKIVGFDIGPLTAKARSEFAISSSVNGVLITDVVAGTDAAEKGLIPGYVIEEINQKRVASATEVADLIGGAREAGRPAVLLKIVDPTGTKRFIAVKLD